MGKIPSPHDCGLPPKFSAWRSHQEAALDSMLHSTKRVKALCAPTGTGKTITAVAYALLTKQPTCIVTATRALQTQYMEDFGSIGMVDIRGRHNYICDLKPGMTCEDGYAARCPYKGSVGCPSSQAEMRAATSSLVVTNYAKWTAARKFGNGMSHFTQVIFDESHVCHQALSDAMQVTLHHREIEETLGLNFPEGPLEFQNWKGWAAEARALSESMMIAVRSRIAGASDPKQAWVKHYTHMRNLSRRLATVATARAKDWIVDEIKDGYQFDPVRPGRYAESALLLRVPSIVMMSATLRPKSLYQIGISKEAHEFQEFPSDFDRRRCPIYYIPTMRVDIHHPDLSSLWILLDQIAARRQDRKGLVHTISFARRDEILGSSRFSGRMLINPRGEPATAMIDVFGDSGPGTILVSPSMGAGYDFKGKLAEWQFICKIPFPDGRSKIMKARQEDDKEYGPNLAAQDLAQMAGRIMRMKEDQGETFIGDEHLDWFMPRYRHLFPKSFHHFFQRVEVLPQPPPPLR